MESTLLEQEDLKTLVELYHLLDEYISFFFFILLELPEEEKKKNENS